MLLATTLVLALVATACGDDSTEAQGEGEPAADEPAAEEPAAEEPAADEPAADEPAPQALGLSDVCPNPIVIQNSWIPQATEGFLYSLVPLEQAEFDSTSGTVSGPAAADPSVTIEILAGGPAIGFQSVVTQLYSHPEILLALNNMDSMIEVSEEFPTKAVFAPYAKHPFGLMYAEEAFPEGIQSFDDVRESGATVLAVEGQTWAPALVALGELDQSQLDTSFDFSPARFVEAQGGLFQVAFGNIDRLGYVLDLGDWNAEPIGMIYAADGGYPNFRAVFARPEIINEQSECLEQLVPAMQQAQIDYVDNPGPLNEAIFTWIDEMEQFGYSVEASIGSISADVEDGLIGNGPSGYVGEMDPEAVSQLLDIVLPIFEERGSRVDANLSPDDIATNEFLDEDVGFATG